MCVHKFIFFVCVLKSLCFAYIIHLRAPCVIQSIICMWTSDTVLHVCLSYIISICMCKTHCAECASTTHHALRAYYSHCHVLCRCNTHCALCVRQLLCIVSGNHTALCAGNKYCESTALLPRPPSLTHPVGSRSVSAPGPGTPVGAAPPPWSAPWCRVLIACPGCSHPQLISQL